MLYEISKTYWQFIVTISLYSHFPRVADDSPNIEDENLRKSKISKLAYQFFIKFIRVWAIFTGFEDSGG